MPTIPTIHDNGTPKAALLAALTAADEAIGKAAKVLVQTAPNARDYYPQGPDAWGKARDEWTEIQTQLRTIREKVVAAMVHIHEQAR